MSELLYEQAMMWVNSKRKHGASVEQISDALYEALLEILPHNDPIREKNILNNIFSKVGNQLGVPTNGNKNTSKHKPKTEKEILFEKIPNALLEDDGECYFAVDGAKDYNSNGWIWSFYFKEESDAKAMYSLLAQKYGCVRLYELGSRINQQKNYEKRWMAYWWSDDKFVGEKPSGRGWGIPEENLKPVEYDSIQPMKD